MDRLIAAVLKNYWLQAGSSHEPVTGVAFVFWDMAATEMNTAGTEGDQKEKLLSPSEEDTVLNDTAAPLNFSELTPCQFGISIQSFTPAASSNRKDKSRLAQIKARRRSNIGVRGSPETNSLIRFMAQQRMKTPLTHQTPE
ncbi:cell division cycle-associated protein 2 isoform X1, partial [Lates japonicus]